MMQNQDSIALVPDGDDTEKPSIILGKMVTTLLESCCLCKAPLHHSRSPQLFPCLHSACKQCLLSPNVEEDHSKRKCPTCQKLFDTKDITENVIFQESLSRCGKSDTTKCGGCEEATVSGWCQECGELLCSECVAAHSRVRLTRDHTVVPPEQFKGFHPIIYCTSHKEEPLKFFCKSCNQLTCRNCQLVDHRNHSYQMISEAATGIRESLQILQEKLNQQKSAVTQSLSDLDNRLLYIINTKATIKQNLCLLLHKLYKELQKKSCNLCQSAQTTFLQEEHQLHKRKQALKELEERQAYVLSFIEKLNSEEGLAGIILRSKIEHEVNNLLSQNTLPASSMLEVNVVLNRVLLASFSTFGEVLTKAVPFARTNPSASQTPLSSASNAHSGSTTNTQSGSATQSQSGSTTQSQSGSTTNTQSGSTTNTQSGSTSKSQSGSTTQSQSGSTTQSQSGSTTQSQSVSTTNTQSGSTTNTQSGSTSKTQIGSTSNTKIGSASNTQIGSTTNTQIGSTSNSQSGSTSNSQSGSTSNTQRGSTSNTQRGSKVQKTRLAPALPPQDSSPALTVHHYASLDAQQQPSPTPQSSSGLRQSTPIVSVSVPFGHTILIPSNVSPSHTDSAQAAVTPHAPQSLAGFGTIPTLNPILTSLLFLPNMPQSAPTQSSLKPAKDLPAEPGSAQVSSSHSSQSDNGRLILPSANPSSTLQSTPVVNLTASSNTPKSLPGVALTAPVLLYTSQGQLTPSCPPQTSQVSGSQSQPFISRVDHQQQSAGPSPLSPMQPTSAHPSQLPPHASTLSEHSVYLAVPKAGATLKALVEQKQDPPYSQNVQNHLVAHKSVKPDPGSAPFTSPSVVAPTQALQQSPQQTPAISHPKRVLTDSGGTKLVSSSPKSTPVGSAPVKQLDTTVDGQHVQLSERSSGKPQDRSLTGKLLASKPSLLQQENKSPKRNNCHKFHEYNPERRTNEVSQTRHHSDGTTDPFEGASVCAPTALQSTKSSTNSGHPRFTSKFTVKRKSQPQQNSLPSKKDKLVTFHEYRPECKPSEVGQRIAKGCETSLHPSKSRRLSEEKDTELQLTQKDLNVHGDWLSGLPSSFRDVLGVPPSKENLPDQTLIEPFETDDTCKEPSSEDKQFQVQVAKQDDETHRTWISGLPQPFREILEDPSPRQNLKHPLENDLDEEGCYSQADDADSISSGVTELSEDPEECTLPKEMAECRVDLYRLNITFPPPGEPLPCFRVRTNGHHITSLQEIEEEQEDNILAWERDSASPCSLNSEESGINCEVCNTAGGRLICQECGRGYHGPCHVPPITTLHQVSSWTCSICQDLTDSTDPFRKERHKKPMMSTVDQRKCEHLVLTLMCKSWSDVLYTSGKDVPSDVDFECIHMRLLRKMSPPYRTPSELVSDVWVLLESLLDTSEDPENVQRIHRFFKKKVQRVFGNCIHPSVLVGPRGYQDKDNRQIEEDTLTEEWDSSDDYMGITAKKRRRK